MLTLLFIDDDERDIAILSQTLLNFIVIGKQSGAEGLNTIAERHIDVVLLDLILPDMNGFTVLSHIQSMDSPPPVVILSGHGKPENVVRALQLGARHFVEKPFTLSLLLTAIDTALGPIIEEDTTPDCPQEPDRPAAGSDKGAAEASIGKEETSRGELEKPKETVETLTTDSGPADVESTPGNVESTPADVDSGPENNEDPFPLGRFIGSSENAKALKRLVNLYASNELPVLLIGESGTGKELLARALHELSSRKEGPFKPLNAGAIPESLIESELYGTVKGAFTDAGSRPGYFEQSHEGTLFLDEVGELSLNAQTKFLRILEEQSIVRVGGKRRIPIDVRVVCATNRPLQQLVEEGRFRRDLFYRINTLTVPIPPLRARFEDLDAIALSFFSFEGVEKWRVSGEALKKLKSHTWPGNIRELQNIIKKAVILARGGRVEAEHIVFFSEVSEISFGTELSTG